MITDVSFLCLLAFSLNLRLQPSSHVFHCMTQWLMHEWSCQFSQIIVSTDNHCQPARLTNSYPNWASKTNFTESLAITDLHFCTCSLHSEGYFVCLFVRITTGTYDHRNLMHFIGFKRKPTNIRELFKICPYSFILAFHLR